MDTQKNTDFASPERSSLDAVKHDSEIFARQQWIKTVMDAVPGAFLILNENRQIVFANETLSKMTGKPLDQIISKRPGEILGCLRADVNAAGCGTSSFCEYCGAMRAILDAQAGATSVQECRVSLKTGDALDLRVWSKPFDAAGRCFVLFAVSDIADEKRRQSLERTFFHDILNTAGGIQGLSGIISEEVHGENDSLNEIVKLISSASDTLVEEIQAQKQLLSAENGELGVSIDNEDSLAICRDVVDIYKRHPAAHGKNLLIGESSKSVTFLTDRPLLKRILGNMVKNALEACAPGKTATISCFGYGDNIVFSVHNPSVMPKDVQMQIFQRSFSTKGKGRGIGSYSIKLFSEKYLSGKVSFESTPEGGTTFFAQFPVSQEAQAAV